jgi:hypothetical protein
MARAWLMLAVAIVLAAGLAITHHHDSPARSATAADLVRINVPPVVTSGRTFTAIVSGDARDKAQLVVYTDPNRCAPSNWQEGRHLVDGSGATVSVWLGGQHLNQTFMGVHFGGRFDQPFSFAAGRARSRPSYVCAYLATNSGRRTTANAVGAYAISARGR